MSLSLVAEECVGEEHGDGHGADAAGYGSDVGGDFRDIVEVDVAGQRVRGGRAADADIDDDGAGFDHIGLDEVGVAEGSDEDVGGSTMFVKVFGEAMDDGDGGVAVGCFLHEEGGEWFADDVAPADDDDVFALEWDLVVVEEDVDAVRSAGDKAARLSDEEFAHVDRVKAVDIFCGIDAADDVGGIDAGRQRELDEDAVDRGIFVEEVDFLLQFLFGDGGRVLFIEGEDTDLKALFLLSLDIGA